MVCTTRRALIQLKQDLQCKDFLHWIRNNQVLEDRHRYRNNSDDVMAALSTAAMNMM
jgi:hypothetical protein